MKAFLTATLAAVASAAVNDHWAVIVAGSSGYSNYRHQADTAHAYQILKENGIAEDHIIHMAYDDIRNNRSNPFPGEMYNHPDGENVAKNLKIDYTGKQVTPENFLAVLTGDSKTTGGLPVLESDSNSKVFVYFADHGAPGLIAFPHDVLYADELNKAIQTMHQNKMYEHLVIYIEACESGSMFEDLDTPNVYALTAANASESSWGYYCYPDDVVNGKHINSCLGDTFSINWMEDSDAHDLGIESLLDQYKYVLKKTTRSHVQEFGDLSIQSEHVGHYQGVDEGNSAGFFKNMIHKFNKKIEHKKDHEQTRKISEVDSRDATLHHLYNMVMNEGSQESHQNLAEHLEMRMRTDRIFQTIFEDVNVDETLPVTKFDCLRFLVNSYETHCEALNDYSLKHVRYMSNHCEIAEPSEIFRAAAAFAQICQ